MCWRVCWSVYDSGSQVSPPVKAGCVRAPCRTPPTLVAPNVPQAVDMAWEMAPGTGAMDVRATCLVLHTGVAFSPRTPTLDAYLVGENSTRNPSGVVW